MGLLKNLGSSLSTFCESYSMEDTLTNLNTVENFKSKGEDTLYRFEYKGAADHVTMNAELVKIFGDPILMQEDRGGKTYCNEYIDDSTFVRIYFNDDKDKQLEVRGLTTQSLIYDKIKKLSVFIDTKKAFKSIFALVSSPEGLLLKSIGKVDHDLVEDDYTKDTVEGYNHVVNCFASNDPCGRLILLQGPPGTGKSFMIRSLVSNVNSIFIVVGAQMISELSGPSILPVIMGCVDSDDKKPITFILEDSDIALSHRKHGGVAELSGLLNLGDGLLGELLDIRIVATTNAELINLDPAIVRPGRMCQRINLKAFSPKEANERYANLVKDKTVNFRKDTTLAEIYRLAREDGWVPNAEDKPKDGQYL